MPVSAHSKVPLRDGVDLVAELALEYPGADQPAANHLRKQLLSLVLGGDQRFFYG